MCSRAGGGLISGYLFQVLLDECSESCFAETRRVVMSIPVFLAGSSDVDHNSGASVGTTRMH